MTFLIKRILMAVIMSAGLSSTAYAANQIHYVINNHLGAPEMLVDQSQHVVWQAEYDEFGKANVLVHEVEFNQRLPGQYYDKETGLSYNYYRDYDSSTGRYVQSDPIGLMGGINTYAYVLGNPIMFIDPLGLFGTQSCAYWAQTCEANGGTYECKVATDLCPRFPDNNKENAWWGDDEAVGNWSECARQCLQEKHKDRMEDSQACSGDNQISLSDNKDDHLSCWAGCMANPENPYDPSGPDLPDGNPSLY